MGGTRRDLEEPPNRGRAYLLGDLASVIIRITGDEDLCLTLSPLEEYLVYKN